MKIIDFHTHVYPDKIAARTTAELSETAGVTAACAATYTATVSSMMDWGVSSFVALNILMNPQRQDSAIEFSASLKAENIYPFCSVHPKTENPEAAICRMKELGLYGIKMHPDYQNFFIDDENMFEIYALCEKYGFPLMFHVGFDPYSPDLIHGTPLAVSKVAKQFPKLRVIAAHMGGMQNPTDVEKYLVGLENVWFDTSMSAGYLKPEAARRIITSHPNIVFGSDCPWHSSTIEIEYIRSLSLNSVLEDKIFHENAEKLLG